MACVFIDNNATKGGALWSNKEQTVQISEFINNHASDKGGAVYYGTGYYSTNNKITNLIGNSYFKYNSADNWGGAIYCYSGKYGGKPFGGYAEGCTFVNNECIHDNGVTGATTVDCIFRGNVVIDAADLDKYYGESEKFNVKITEDDKALSNASVKITVNGKTSSVATDSNGQASIDLDLPVGTYDVVTECEDVKVTSKATVRSTIAASDVSGTYLNSKVTATFSDTAGKALASKQVIFKVGDKSYSANTDSNGVAAADIPLSVGTYTVAAVNPANNEQKTFKLTISKADSKVALTSAQSNEVITLTAALAPASARGNVVFSVNGENKNVAVSNGKATLTLKDLKPGDYKVTASYAGDNNLYASTSNTVTFSIAESYPVLSANPVTKTYGTSTGLVVYLKDNKANAISNVVVNVNINNKITPITTGSDGRATMPISLAPGLYTATITYADAKATAKITVKKATVKMTAKAKTFKKSVKTKKYTVTLKINQNKGMKNTKVTIKVNKKTYSAKTNKNGVATFKLKKLTKKGKFTATVTYKGNACYKKLTKKVKITVK